MYSEQSDNNIAALRIFFYSTDLPARIYKDDVCLFGMPEKIVSAASILEDKMLAPAASDTDPEVQILQNDLREKVLVLNLLKCGQRIVIGPLLTEKVESGTITNLIRNGLIPFHQKKVMQDYYNNCKLISEKKLFYSAKLLKRLFTDSAEINTEIGDVEEKISIMSSVSDSENESYYMQKKKYRHDVFKHSPYTVEQEICKTICNGDTENAKRLLKEINLVPHAQLAATKLRSYKNSMICSCTFMTRAAISGGVNPDDAFTLSDTYINQIENINDIQELESFEAAMLEGFTAKVRELNNQIYSLPILKTIYYIDNHLCEDIEIKQLANEAFLNPSYLSTLFHKETGYRISEWINKKRIEEAAFYVKNSTEDFAQIALFYHFCSQSYFVQCFKKIMGVTPGEYRKGKTAK